MFVFGSDLAGRKGSSCADEGKGGVSSVTGGMFFCCGFDCDCDCDCWAFRRRARRDWEREGFVVVAVFGGFWSEEGKGEEGVVVGLLGWLGGGEREDIVWRGVGWSVGWEEREKRMRRRRG